MLSARRHPASRQPKIPEALYDMEERAHSTRILIADDHPLFRHGLRRFLEAQAGLSIVGEAGDGSETLRLARTLRPDVLLLDVSMPKINGLDVLRSLSSTPSRIIVVLLTAAIERQLMIEALKLGARGVVLKDAAGDVLTRCLRAVTAGQYWVGRECMADLVESTRALSQPVANGDGHKSLGLTRRELEVVSAIAAGCSNKDVARKFSISEETVKHHLTNIFDKMGVSSRLELALTALHRGVSPSP